MYATRAGTLPDSTPFRSVQMPPRLKFSPDPIQPEVNMSSCGMSAPPFCFAMVSIAPK